MTVLETFFDLATDDPPTGMNTGVKYGLDPKVLAGESQQIAPKT